MEIEIVRLHIQDGDIKHLHLTTSEVNGIQKPVSLRKQLKCELK